MTTLEMVIYSVKPDHLDSYPVARNKMRNVLTRWNGFRSGVTFQSIEKEATLFDYYLWDSQEDAVQAAKRIQSDPEARDFLDCIGTIAEYRRLEIGSDQPDFTSTDDGDVFEVALGIVDPEKQELFTSVKPELFDLVRKESGLKQISSAGAVTNDGFVNLDILRWETIEAANTAAERIHKTEQCSIFISTFKEDIYFGHMSKFA